MTQIHFTSSERPTRIAKALTRAFEASGTRFAFSKVREATAVMYGYRGWNDLLGQIGKRPASPYDQDIETEEVSHRRALFIERMSKALDVGHEFVAATIDGVGPMSRATRKHGVTTWSQTVERLAAGLMALSSKVVQETVAGVSGARITLKPRGPRVVEYLLLVAPSGDIVWQNLKDDGPDRFDPDFGELLQNAGLLEHRDVEAAPPPEFLVSTLKRISGDALHILRTAPVFSVAAYDYVRATEEDAPIRRVLQQFPMLGVWFENRAHAESNRFDNDFDPTRSKDPVATFLQAAEKLASQWPHPFDKDGARRALVALGSEPLLTPYGLARTHVAFLSFAPAEALPKGSAQIRAAMRVAEDLDTAFTDGAISPAAFFREFRDRYGHNWIDLAALSYDDRRFADHLVTDIGNAVGMKLALELSIDTAKLNDNDATYEIGLRLARRVGEGLGFVEYNSKARAWYDSLNEDDDAPEKEVVETGFANLSSTGLLPTDLQGLSARDLVERLQISLPEITDPDEGLMVNKDLFFEQTIGGVLFEAFATPQGPVLNAKIAGDLIGWAYLGTVAYIFYREAEPGRRKAEEAGWYVCKYDANQPHIHLRGFSQSEVQAVAEAFAIPQGYDDEFSMAEFMDTPCFEALRAWAKKRPDRVASLSKTSTYMPNWQSAAAQYNRPPSLH